MEQIGTGNRSAQQRFFSFLPLGRLETVYPMTAVFNLSGYYHARVIQTLIGVIVLLTCVVLSHFQVL